MKIIAVDTETTPRHVPFLATTTDEQMKGVLYRLKNRNGRDYHRLKKICEDRSIVKVFHPATFDIYALSKIGIKVRGQVECTMTAASLVNENFTSKRLKVMARDLLHEETTNAKELTKVKAKYKKIAKAEGKEFSYDMIPREYLEPYAVDDTNFTIMLWYYFKDAIKEYDTIYQFEKSLIPIIVKMQNTGMRVDRTFAKKMARKYRKDQQIYFDEIQEYFLNHGIRKPEFNPGSPKQVGEVIERLGIPIKERTKKGFTATDAKTLKQYFKKQPFVRSLLRYRFCAKQAGTYFEPLAYRYTSPLNDIAHFTLWQSGAKTGRFSAELIQTIPRPGEAPLIKAPKLARMAFIPRDGYRFVSIDYKGIEMRLFFHFAQATALIEKIKAGWDPHDATSDLLFNKVNEAVRHTSKDMNFGFIFGMGKEKLAKSLGFSPEKTAKIFKKYYEHIPVQEYMTEVRNMLNRNGLITIEYDSPLMSFVRDYHLPVHLSYKGVNMIIQGTAAYVLKHAMKRVAKLIREKGMDVIMDMTIHDELLFEVSKKENLKLVVRELAKCMEDRVTFDVPIEVDVKVSDVSWGDVQKYKWR